METRKVFVACSLGGFIGALVALQMWQPFWWAGLIVGGLVGYLAYDFKEVIEAIPAAWRKATSKRARARLRIFFRAWLGASSIMTIFAPFPVIVWLTAQRATPLFLMLFWLGVYFFLASTYAVTELVTIRFPLLRRKKVRRYHILWFYGHCLPSLVVWGLRQIPMFVAEVLSAAADGWRAARSFLWHLFVMIHSEFRLLCGLDAAIGTAIGYFAENALIGALAGGLFGVANYEILSKRVLHLVSTR